MTYAIEFKKSAQKELKKLPKAEYKRLYAAIKKLGNNPKLGDVRPMIGSTAWRLRVGKYRVIYDIDSGRVVVLVLKVGHRREVYR